MLSKLDVKRAVTRGPMAASLAVGVTAFFLAPAWRAAHGAWPIPLDDVYIHFDFARAWAGGHPFEWIAGQGYSSGETAPLYAVVLAAGYLVGFHGAGLGAWATLVALGSVVFAVRALSRFALPAVTAAVILCCGKLDFALVSGMEVALWVALAAALVVAVHRACDPADDEMRRHQWMAGLLGMLLVLVRPESVAVVAVAMFVVGRGAGATSAVTACARTAAPAFVATLLVACLNLAFTGHAASAGALLKLLSSNPFSTDLDRSRDYAVNVVTFVRALGHDLGGTFSFVFVLLGLASLSTRRTRPAGALCLLSALAYTLLVSWNGAASYQNLRAYAPASALLLFACVLGLSALSSLGRPGLVGFVVGLAGVGYAWTRVPESARLFARAAENIADQQVVAGHRLAERAKPGSLVLLGDAGAIPYVSGLHAVDAFGLGGYRAMPFVTAAVDGEAAVVELIERMPSRERPDLLALYPSWFPDITKRFGKPWGAVTLDDNVICGGPTKGLYDADWSALRGEADPPDEALDTLDEIDVADVVSEGEHGYRSPAPLGGFTLLDVRLAGSGARRFDGGRITPEGQEESFEVRAPVPPGSSLVIRTDGTPSTVSVVWGSDDTDSPASPLQPDPPVESDRWSLSRAPVPVMLQPGDRVRLRVVHGSLHDFHAWLVRGKA